MPEWTAYPALFAVGLVAGTLNVVAGGGSFLTLPLLIFFGLPPSLANGTNRVGIWLQNAGAVWGFHRHRALDRRLAVFSAVPASIGAALGTWLALEVSDQAFKKILASLMVAITLYTLLRPGAGEESETRPPESRGRRALLALFFFVIGVYGGFVQAGVGFFFLAATSFAGLDLVRGNAVKVFCVLVFTSLSLAIFAAQGRVVWGLGLALAAGTLLGGQAGVRLTVLKGHRWVRAVVTAAVIVFALKLWFS